MQDLIAPTPKSGWIEWDPGIHVRIVAALGDCASCCENTGGVTTRTRSTETAQAMGGCQEGPSVGARARSP